MDGMEIIKTLAARGYMVEPDALEALGGDCSPLLLDRLLSIMDPLALTVSREDVARLHASKGRPEASEGSTSPRVRVISDITNNSTCIGDYDEFVGYFRDRYGRLGDMMRHRVSARPIESLKKKNFARGEKAELSVIGMVSDVRQTANGNRLVELEGHLALLIDS